MTPVTSQPTVIQPIVPQSRTPPNCAEGLGKLRNASELASPYDGAVSIQYPRKSKNNATGCLVGPIASRASSAVPIA